MRIITSVTFLFFTIQLTLGANTFLSIKSNNNSFCFNSIRMTQTLLCYELNSAWGLFKKFEIFVQFFYLVNHSEHFVSPILYVHTNNVECCWGHLKYIRKSNGTWDQPLESHFEEYVWRKKFPSLVFQDIMIHIVQQY